MRTFLTLTLFLLALSLSVGVAADQELVRTAQKDLVALGYDPGNIQGEMTTATIVAVSKFQAEHDMPVTGEVTPQLVGAIKAALTKRNQPAAAPAPMTSQQQQADLQARQRACLQEKQAAAQERQKTKRGVMSLLRAASRTSSQFGGSEVASTINQTSNTVYNVNATADDISSAAKDLGLTEEEVEACRNPPQ